MGSAFKIEGDSPIMVLKFRRFVDASCAFAIRRTDGGGELNLIKAAALVQMEICARLILMRTMV